MSGLWSCAWPCKGIGDCKPTLVQDLPKIYQQKFRKYYGSISKCAEQKRVERRDE